MSKFIVSARSASDWTFIELAAFNITVQNVPFKEFFGNHLDVDPYSSISPVILNNIEAPNGNHPKSIRLFFQYLQDAMRPVLPEYSFTSGFAAFLLSMLDLDEPDRVVHRRQTLTYVMCEANVQAQTDVCIKNLRDGYILLLQEDKVSSFPHLHLPSY